MKRILTTLSMLGGTAALLLILGLRLANIPEAAGGNMVSADSAAPVPLDPMALNQPQRVEFDVSDEAMDELSSREWRDQLRDWLLFTAAGAAGLSVDEFDQALFDRQAVRYGYLRPLGSFEYGETRSVVIGEGKVLALVPARAKGDRLEDLAQVADEHRKNLGEVPTTLFVYEYEIDPDGRAGSLTRREPVDGRLLFTPEYGYHEASIGGVADLERFMGQIDALSMARRDGERLILGGRKLGERAYRGIRLEDVAALWQSEHRIQTRLSGFEARWDSVEKEFNARWYEQMESTPDDIAGLKLRRDEELQLLSGRMAQERRAEGVVEGSGFSLDPAYDFPALRQYLRGVERLLRAMAVKSTAAITPRDIEAADSGLAQQDANALLDLTGTLVESGQTLDSIMGAELWTKIEQSRFQAARYDGDLKGTEVGMVLFYTDLLAKLWALDYMRSAPGAFIEDFRAMPHLTLSPIYRHQVDSLGKTRLWFGKQDAGFQSAKEGDVLLLSRNATRVYAASASPFRPGEESPPNAASGSFLGWWNDHYDEVARFEPEYQRLNEIMKWSLVIGWLSQAHALDALNFLDGVPVDRSHWFPDWVRKHPELKFQDWAKVSFFARGYKGTRTEALPRLNSVWYSNFGDDWRGLTGGVSLASRQAFTERVPLPANLRAISRRSNLDYTQVLADGSRFRTLDGMGIERKQMSRAGWSMEFTPAKNAKLRGGTSELAAQKLERVTTSRAGVLEIESRAESGEIGTLNLARTENGFAVGWRSRDIDRGQSLARRVSRAPDPLAGLAADPAVETMIVLMEGEAALVRMTGSNRWMMLASERTPSAEIAPGWSARVADIRARRNVQIAWLDDAAVRAKLETDGYVVMEAAGENRTMLTQVREATPPAGSKPVTIEVGGTTLSGHVDPSARMIYLRFPDLPEAIRADVGELGRLVRPTDLTAIYRAAETNAATAAYRIPTSRPTGGDAVIRDLRRRDYDATARALVDDPATFRAGVEGHLTENLARSDRLLADAQYREAREVLNGLREIYGSVPDVTLRKALAELGEGRVRNAAAALRPTRPVPLRDRHAFFEEINRRLEQSWLTETDRRNLHTVAEVGDWNQLEAGRPAPQGRVFVGSSDGTLVLQYRLEAVPGGRPLGVADLGLLADGKASIYVQNSPGLNNLDWSAGLQHSLRQAVSGNLGKVVRLPRGDIAHFKPAVIYGPDPATKFEAVRRPELVRTAGRSYRSVQGDRCVNEEAENCEPAYLVIASSGSGH